MMLSMLTYNLGYEAQGCSHARTMSRSLCQDSCAPPAVKVVCSAAGCNDDLRVRSQIICQSRQNSSYHDEQHHYAVLRPAGLSCPSSFLSEHLAT